jgi:hypothetical protein
MKYHKIDQPFGHNTACSLSEVIPGNKEKDQQSLLSLVNVDKMRKLRGNSFFRAAKNN